MLMSGKKAPTAFIVKDKNHKTEARLLGESKCCQCYPNPDCWLEPLLRSPSSFLPDVTPPPISLSDCYLHPQYLWHFTHLEWRYSCVLISFPFLSLSLFFIFSLTFTHYLISAVQRSLSTSASPAVKSPHHTPTPLS